MNKEFNKQIIMTDNEDASIYMIQSIDLDAYTLKIFVNMSPHKLLPYGFDLFLLLVETD